MKASLYCYVACSRAVRLFWPPLIKESSFWAKLRLPKSYSQRGKTRSAPACQAYGMMKHRRATIVNNNRTTIGVNNDDWVESYFPKRRISNKESNSFLPLFKFQRLRRQHQVQWSAAAIVSLLTLLFIAFFCYANQIYYVAQSETDLRISNMPSNWWNPHDHSHLLQRCNIPFLPFEHNPIWTCYNDLVDENYDTVLRANQLFNYYAPQNYSASGRISIAAAAAEKEEERTDSRIIPHLLIFTHKYNIFNCTSISAYNNNVTTATSSSSSQQPPNDIYTLAENVKSTIKAYSRIWHNDMHFVYLSDADCITAINATEPELVSHFTNDGLEGMFKADICRIAFLYLHGGYYFDVDLLVVQPFVAPPNVSFVTVKGEGQTDGTDFRGFFQAFIAAEPYNIVIRQSLSIMLDILIGKRTTKNNMYLGPGSLMEAYMEVMNITHISDASAAAAAAVTNNNNANNNGIYLLQEVNLNNNEQTSKYTNLSNILSSSTDLLQRVPSSHTEDCVLSTGGWNVCNYVVMDDVDDSMYFYSRVLGTPFCGVCLGE